MVDPVGMSEGMTRAACVQGYDFLQPIRKASVERDEYRRDVCERDPPLELRFSGQQEKKIFSFAILCLNSFFSVFIRF